MCDQNTRTKLQQPRGNNKIVPPKNGTGPFNTNFKLLDEGDDILVCITQFYRFLEYACNCSYTKCLRFTFSR